MPQVPVVGLGASAGELESRPRFFRAVASDSGLSDRVVQHLSASFKSMMDALLRRRTTLPIAVARDGLLLLGPSESTHLGPAFDPVDVALRIFEARSKPKARAVPGTLGIARPQVVSAKIEPTLLAAYDALRDRTMPPGVLAHRYAVGPGTFLQPRERAEILLSAVTSRPGFGPGCGVLRASAAEAIEAEAIEAEAIKAEASSAFIRRAKDWLVVAPCL